MRGAASISFVWRFRCKISTHAPHARRGSQLPSLSADWIKISTHAPHARRGLEKPQSRPSRRNFYSRASCEARLLPPWFSPLPRLFLLTRLMRGAAAMIIRSFLLCQHFYSRASCEARLLRLLKIRSTTISTHAPHARRGDCAVLAAADSFIFYSREARQISPKN